MMTIVKKRHKYKKSVFENFEKSFVAVKVEGQDRVKVEVVGK